MYNELIKRLRCPNINSCPIDDNDITCRKCQRNIAQQAADAIEYLLRCLSGRARWEEIERLRAELERIRQEATPAVRGKDGQEADND